MRYANVIPVAATVRRVEVIKSLAIQTSVNRACKDCRGGACLGARTHGNFMLPIWFHSLYERRQLYGSSREIVEP